MEKNRFEFGKNWAKFLKNLSDERIKEAEKSLLGWLSLNSLDGKTFLDVGSGSGLFSLAARNCGAVVHSFDYDNESVACTEFLREKYYKNDRLWSVERGDVLSDEYLSKYEPHDIVYSWGVLHHTGNMYQAFENVAKLVKKDGLLFIAIYNDQGRQSKIWKCVKKMYVSSPKVVRAIILFFSLVRLWLPRTLRDFVILKPFRSWRTYKKNRGMSPWRDLVDWVGGYPFEVAKPEEVFDFFAERGFILKKMSTEGRNLGCNQYVFKRTAG